MKVIQPSESRAAFFSYKSSAVTLTLRLSFDKMAIDGKAWRQIKQPRNEDIIVDDDAPVLKFA